MQIHDSDEASTSLHAPSVALRGMVAGLVAAAGVIGLLLGIGRRAGTTWRPLNAAAHTLMGAKADDVWSFHPSVTPMGGLVVLAMSVAAGLIVARLASSRRALHVVAAAVAVAIIGYLLHVHVVARSSGGLAALLSVGELRALYLVLGLSLVGGMCVASSPRGNLSGP